ncbi:hypothetical protein TIFTF001_025284, partial [Ficus carica]
AVGQAAEE